MVLGTLTIHKWDRLISDNQALQAFPSSNNLMIENFMIENGKNRKAD